MLGSFKRKGKASFIIGGQWGSESKGSAAAFAARHLAEYGRHFGLVTTNAGAQAGHTSIHNGNTRVVFHLPTAPLISAEYGMRSTVYLNAGSIIDPTLLQTELDQYGGLFSGFFVHPNAAVITDECKEAEMAYDSAQTKIASTRKGVGEALSRKVLRSGMIARNHPYLSKFVRRMDLNARLTGGMSILCEIPQGFSLGVNERFYPHCTSRPCTVGQAMTDADIHPVFYGSTMMVIRTFPIRVGNIQDESGNEIGNSGSHYPDQQEIDWDKLGVKAEITTVTKRVRRVFTFSFSQLHDAMISIRPDIIFLAFCNYVKEGDRLVEAITKHINLIADRTMLKPELIYQYGASTDDVYDHILKVDDL